MNAETYRPLGLDREPICVRETEAQVAARHRRRRRRGIVSNIVAVCFFIVAGLKGDDLDFVILYELIEQLSDRNSPA